MYQAAAEGGAGTGRVRSASQHGHGYARSEAWEAFGLDGRTQKSTKDGVVSTPYYLELDLGDVEDELSALVDQKTSGQIGAVDFKAALFRLLDIKQARSATEPEPRPCPAPSRRGMPYQRQNSWAAGTTQAARAERRARVKVARAAAEQAKGGREQGPKDRGRGGVRGEWTWGDGVAGSGRRGQGVPPRVPGTTTGRGGREASREHGSRTPSGADATPGRPPSGGRRSRSGANGSRSGGSSSCSSSSSSSGRSKRNRHGIATGDDDGPDTAVVTANGFPDKEAGVKAGKDDTAPGPGADTAEQRLRNGTGGDDHDDGTGRRSDAGRHESSGVEDKASFGGRESATTASVLPTAAAALPTAAAAAAVGEGRMGEGSRGPQASAKPGMGPRTLPLAGGVSPRGVRSGSVADGTAAATTAAGRSRQEQQQKLKRQLQLQHEQQQRQQQQQQEDIPHKGVSSPVHSGGADGHAGETSNNRTSQGFLRYRGRSWLMGRRNRSTGKGSFVCEQRESENGLDGTALESKLSGSVADDGHREQQVSGSTGCSCTIS